MGHVRQTQQVYEVGFNPGLLAKVEYVFRHQNRRDGGVLRKRLRHGSVPL